MPNRRRQLTPEDRHMVRERHLQRAFTGLYEGAESPETRGCARPGAVEAHLRQVYPESSVPTGLPWCLGDSVLKLDQDHV